jgi:hypothetical protein
LHLQRDQYCVSKNIDLNSYSTIDIFKGNSFINGVFRDILIFL